jgi:hypothetical protein
MPVLTELRRVAATRYVTPLYEGGSLPALVEADDDGMYVAKFRGAGQGPLALVAEVLVGELARTLALRVPELVTLDLDAAIGRAEPDPEIQDLLLASAGVNLGVDFLPGALPYSPATGWQPDPELAADVVWLDALTTNVDRTARNPNMLLWHENLWLIDHGAALYLQHGGLDPAAHATRAFPHVTSHVLLPCAAAITEAHARLAPQVTRAALEETAALVPEEWLGESSAADYVDYLERRLAWGGFVDEAEAARAG